MRVVVCMCVSVSAASLAIACCRRACVDDDDDDVCGVFGCSGGRSPCSVWSERSSAIVRWARASDQRVVSVECAT